ncbi:AAA family ATPase [Haliovirga abyssi]|uniref:AAA-ATPase-like domain-containing protein n=1 Tax=Haliovirga abyssi TaxID=2996794 RepID=A0AAU9DFK9_9FUSO|nr:AAA family ATPase [Haliovirga abyssi]BDU51212.1 hypothetical protein HLVA_17810 [Haliovirga abyssi]
MKKNKKRLPIGDSNFKSIIEEDYYYVDKSMLIKEVIESGRVVLITRPRRFGKTLNQYMLKYFFDIEENNEHLFKNLKIYEEKEIIDKYMNRYPVIFMSLKSLDALNLDDMLAMFKEVIAKLYREYEDYILNSNILKEEEKLIYKNILRKEAKIDEYKYSLKDLLRYVSNYYGEKVMLIIDEYDAPILSAYRNGYYREFMDIFKIFLSEGLKDNIYLEKSVLTGILRVAKESIFSGLNNLKVSTILTNLFNDKFGLLEGEVRELLEYYELDYEEEEVIKWYDGYNFGGMEIYNPFSIINLADENGEIKPYWVNTSSNYLIKELIRKGSATVKEKIEILISGGTIWSRIEEDLVYDDLNQGRESSIWTLFLFSGYLKSINKKEENDEEYYELAIPNRETIRFYKRVVLNLLEEKEIKLENIFNILLLGKIKTFKNEFKNIVMDSISYFDVTSKEPERFYHGLVLGMIVDLRSKYIVKSNRESGLGRADVLLIPRNKNEKGIIIEFKKLSLDDDKNLLESAISGLKQIEDKKYEEEIKSYGVKDVIKVGIAFQGKDVEIASSYDNIEELRSEYRKLEESKKDKNRLSENEKIALNLLNSGVDTEIVAKSTGIAIERVMELRRGDND